MSASGWVHLEVEKILHETEKAFHVRLEDGWEEWLPKSQIDNAEIYEAGDEDVTISITQWLADQKGLGE